MSSSGSEAGTRMRRKSAFKEVGLTPDHESPARRGSPKRPTLKVRFRSKNDIFEPSMAGADQEEWEDTSASSSDDETSVRVNVPRPRARPTSDKFALVAFVIIISTMIAQLVPSGKSRMLAVDAAPRVPASGASVQMIGRRQDSSDPTDYCKKWGHQSALVNGTLYLYGGRKSMSASQKDNTWSMLAHT